MTSEPKAPMGVEEAKGAIGALVHKYGDNSDYEAWQDLLAALAQPKEGWNDFRKELLGLAHQKREEAKRDYRANGKVYAYHDGVAAGLTQAAKMIEAKQPLNLVGSASPTPQGEGRGE